MGEVQNSTDSERPLEDRLNSWKEIAVYLKRDVTTVQRWERREAMPVHRHLHDRMGSVYAFRPELDEWVRSRSLRSASANVTDSAPADENNDAAPALPEPVNGTSPTTQPAPHRNRLAFLVVTAVIGLA